MIDRRNHRQVFPFTAIVGQDLLKLALIINAIVPGGVGVLIRGEKGTAKSTCARALADLLPDSPFVTLPVNTSEDNLVGGLDFEHALNTGRRRFSPGLLAAAHGGVLYVDEVNLLDDHLADLITDVSASGKSIVEREGIGFVHEAEFSLVGTMNPEEGELRPQFLDRFGLCVSVAGIASPELRKELLRRVYAFEKDPKAFLASFQHEQKQEQQRIVKARSVYNAVVISDRQIDFIVSACLQSDCAGHRAEIFANKAARAMAAYDGRTIVGQWDIRIGLGLALVHRMRPAEQGITPSSDRDNFSENAGRVTGHHYTTCLRDPAGRSTSEPIQDDDFRLPFQIRQGESPDSPDRLLRPDPGKGGAIFDIDESVFVSTREVRHKAAFERQKKGRRHCSRSRNKQGRYIRFTSHRTNNDIALDATIRAAAINQKNRPPGRLAVTIRPEDIREKIREHKSRALLIFMVDASGSMGTRLMRETKGAVLSLLLEAYQKRDRVSLIAFKDQKAEVLLAPTSSIELARKKLRDLPAGGKTPLAAGMIQGYELARSHIRRDRKTMPILILISDGKANVGASTRISYSMERAGRIYDEVFSVARAIKNDLMMQSLVINTEPETMGGFGMAERIAEHMAARYIAPERVSAQAISRAVRGIV